MPSVDLVVISAGTAGRNRDLEWEPERRTIDVNVRGFTAVVTAAMEYFEQNSDHASEADGHLVGLSSVAAHVGNDDAPAYNASKAYVSTYLEGLRYRQTDRDADVTITTIEPGFVDTELSMGGFLGVFGRRLGRTDRSSDPEGAETRLRHSALASDCVGSRSGSGSAASTAIVRSPLEGRSVYQ